MNRLPWAEVTMGNSVTVATIRAIIESGMHNISVTDTLLMHKERQLNVCHCSDNGISADNYLRYCERMAAESGCDSEPGCGRRFSFFLSPLLHSVSHPVPPLHTQTWTTVEPLWRKWTRLQVVFYLNHWQYSLSAKQNPPNTRDSISSLSNTCGTSIANIYYLLLGLHN